MKPIFVDMSDSDLQVLLEDVQNEIYRREEIMCIDVLDRLGRVIKEVKESGFTIHLTLASGEVIKVDDIVNTFSYAYDKVYYINQKELEKTSSIPQSEEEVKRNEDKTVACIHAYDDIDCYSCENRHICWIED